MEWNSSLSPALRSMLPDAIVADAALRAVSATYEYKLLECSEVSAQNAESNDPSLLSFFTTFLVRPSHSTFTDTTRPSLLPRTFVTDMHNRNFARFVPAVRRNPVIRFQGEVPHTILEERFKCAFSARHAPKCGSTMHVKHWAAAENQPLSNRKSVTCGTCYKVGHQRTMCVERPGNLRVTLVWKHPHRVCDYTTLAQSPISPAMMADIRAACSARGEYDVKVAPPLSVSDANPGNTAAQDEEVGSRIAALERKLRDAEAEVRLLRDEVRAQHRETREEIRGGFAALRARCEAMPPPKRARLAEQAEVQFVGTSGAAGEEEGDVAHVEHGVIARADTRPTGVLRSTPASQVVRPVTVKQEPALQRF